MKRSGFKRQEYQRPARSPLVLPAAPVKAHATMRVAALLRAPMPKETVRAKPGKRAPTVGEARWMSAIVTYGCIACHIDGVGYRAPAVHHILRGGQRIGHRFSLPLCDPGHHQNGQQLGLISRHPWKAQFEAVYGTELTLLAGLCIELKWDYPT